MEHGVRFLELSQSNLVGVAGNGDKTLGEKLALKNI